MFDSLKFGVGVVSESCFDMYDDTHIHYVYSWKYDNKPADDIEEKLLHVMLARKGRSFPSISSCKAGAHAYARGVCKS